jgi:hypothetical protein
VLESFGPIGDHLREHAQFCASCRDLVRELYGDREIPIAPDPLSPELLELLREFSEDTRE